MKKILATILALTMVFSLGVSAFAADTSPKNIEAVTGDNTAEIDVTLNATLPTATPSYYVTVEWDSMTFEYAGGSAGTWDHTNHQWTGASTGSWTDDSADITITNHSSEGVTVAGSYAPATSGQYVSGTAYNGVTVNFTGPSDTELDAGNAGNIAGTPGGNQTTASVSVSGDPDTAIGNLVVGTVTITITEA